MNEEKTRFFELRKRIFDMIRIRLDGDKNHPLFEGLISVCSQYGDYYEEETGETELVSILLHSTALGGKDDYHQFIGKTMEEALDKLEAQIEEWENEQTQDKT